jgi:multiple sugar transport system permease protein
MATSHAGAAQRSQVLALVTLTVLAILFLVPFIYIIGGSLKSNFDALAHPEQLFSAGWHWDNFKGVWDTINVPREILNSFIMAGAVTFGQIILSALAGYAFARLIFVGRDLLFVVVLATLIIPFEAIFVPLFLMMANWGWIDTYAALIVPSLANPFAIFIFRQFFITVPRELDEAMYTDGGGYLRIFWSLMLPLAGPAVATVFILTFLGEWSNLLKPLVFTQTDSMHTLQVGLSFLDTGAFVSQPKIAWEMAGVVLASIPPILVFLAMQKRFVESIAATGLKG